MRVTGSMTMRLAMQMISVQPNFELRAFEFGRFAPLEHLVMRALMRSAGGGQPGRK